MITQNISELLEEKITLDLEGIDRLYLNAYQPRLQTGGGVAAFFKNHRKAAVASTTLMSPMSKDFVHQIKAFANQKNIDIVRFQKGERKDDITLQRLQDFESSEGVLYIGVAQEKFSTFRVTQRANLETGSTFPWLSRSTVMCNQYYFYIVDEHFGPLFIKFSSYFPYTARVCLNGNEYLKRQLAKQGIDFTPLDNGILSCADPHKAQQIADALDEKKIEQVVRKWLARLPHPFTPQDTEAGFRYELSILQAELARTQVFDRPLSGRYFFEEVIKENLDLGRPDQVSLIFNRRVTKRTPGKFRTRVVTEGVTPSLHISYKWSKIKQYYKGDKALRTETTINNPRDFGIGKKLNNLPALREIGLQANRRLLEVQKVSQNCQVGTEAFDSMNQSQMVDGQKAAALKFGDPRVMALLQALLLFFLLPQGFTNALLREQVARLMGKAPEDYRPGQMTYDLRRLRLHGLIERESFSHRYRVTSKGIKVCLFYTKVHSRLLRGGLSQLFDGLDKHHERKWVSAIQKAENAIEDYMQCAKLAA